MNAETAHIALPAAQQQEQRELVKGAFIASHRRCIPGKEAEYMPLFERFVELQAQGDESGARDVRAQMLPLQEVVSVDAFSNLVTNLGRNFALDTLLRGSSYTAACNLGLAGTGTKAAGDTQASHAGWLEVGGTNAPVYTGNRKTITFNAASSQSITHTAVTYAFTSGGTVAGAFLNLAGSSTKDNTTGTLFSAGNFTGGDKVVASSDTIDVTYTLNG